jgi:hypothetical protein
MGKKVVFTWGRYNPPTIGHRLVMETGAREAKARGADFIILASKTTSPANKNPLSFKDKIRFLKQSFPKYKRYINSDPKLNTLIRVMQFLDKSYDEATIVVGSDRKDDFLRLLNRYNGQDYDFRKIDVALSGNRDPDAEDASGMSASKMRQAAADGDYESFKKGSPIKNPKALYNAVRKGMGVVEEFCSMMNSVHEDLDKSVVGTRFLRMLRLGLVSQKELPITLRAFNDMSAAGQNPQLRDRIFIVTDKILEFVMGDDILYRRFLVLIHQQAMFGEDQRDALAAKALKSKIPYEALLEVYFRGLVNSPLYESLKTPEQYAFERVNSFISGGYSRKKLDEDIWTEVSVDINTYTESKIKSFKDICETGGAGEWGTKKLADAYSSVTPGQPNDTSKIEVLEVAPKNKEAEDFVIANKNKFKSRYGKNWEKILYATAWKLYGD